MPYDEPRGSGDIEHDKRSDVRPGERTREAPAPADRPAEIERTIPADHDREHDQDNGNHQQRGGGGQKPRRPWLRIAIVAVVLAVLIGGGWYWYATKDQASTDDAYTDGHAITISPQVSGYVVELAVTDNQHVMPGQVLVRIDPRDYIAARDKARGALESAQGQLEAARAGLAVAQKNFPARLASAKAQRDSAQATLIRAQADLRRQQNLPKAATTQQTIDEAVANEKQAAAALEQAEAGVQQAEPVPENIAQSQAGVHQLEGIMLQAKAELDQAELNLGYTVIKAPQEGWVTKRNVERGNYLNTGGSIMSLVSPEVWVTANYKESQIDRMRPGDRADLRVDAYPGLKLKGHVDSIQLGSGSKFTAFPPENATGNYVKIVQRVPVKVVIDSGLDPNLPLPLGISVVPTVYLR